MIYLLIKNISKTIEEPQLKYGKEDFYQKLIKKLKEKLLVGIDFFATVFL